MFHQEVTVQDAVIAVSLVETSMQNEMIVSDTSTLHTAFPQNPMADYWKQSLYSKQSRKIDFN